jgi:hypothetical protein
MSLLCWTYRLFRWTTRVIAAGLTTPAAEGAATTIADNGVGLQVGHG